MPYKNIEDRRKHKAKPEVREKAKEYQRKYRLDHKGSKEWVKKQNLATKRWYLKNKPERNRYEREKRLEKRLDDKKGGWKTLEEMGFGKSDTN